MYMQMYERVLRVHQRPSRGLACSLRETAEGWFLAGQIFGQRQIDAQYRKDALVPLSDICIL